MRCEDFYRISVVFHHLKSNCELSQSSDFRESSESSPNLTSKSSSKCHKIVIFILRGFNSESQSIFGCRILYVHRVWSLKITISKWMMGLFYSPKITNRKSMKFLLRCRFLLSLLFFLLFFFHSNPNWWQQIEAVDEMRWILSCYSMMFCEMMLRQEKKNVFDLNSRQLTTLRVNKMMKILLFQGKNVEQNDDVDDGGGVVGGLTINSNDFHD